MQQISTCAGIYFVRLLGEELVSVNDNDLSRRDLCIKVNSQNAKYGRSENLRARFLAYCRTFGAERVRFDVLIENTNPIAVERRLHAHFRSYRIRGLSNKPNEWLKGIDPDIAYDQARTICENYLTAKSELQPRPPNNPADMAKPHKRTGYIFTPDDILKSAAYLRSRGMPEYLLADVHHFGRQTYDATFQHFTGRKRLQGFNNPVYAARLDFIAKGDVAGRSFPDLVKEAIYLFPFPDKKSP
ncbi:hypothetical protein GIY56_07400 [Paracoccus sp. YIM 132242]|uniref:Uncharacterized protein n=1 Tax=Paracoccus lichenicola TaxID=2665644 RepID=A0A6L6HS40_9RHOB|nr:GIY-YIG nuclease family protein [Paracoccus lichenicola]MTE00108.1 hypothetical protein [Paracoccus lichenicola]